MAELRLEGCGSRPLVGYLKSLGLLRVVARQADADARGRWRAGRFELASTLDTDGLATFLLDDYTPSPVVSPWNGGSGFFPKDRSEPLEAIEGSDNPRLAPYRNAIRAARHALCARGLTEKPTIAEKPGLTAHLRRALPDEALEWLDTAIVLTGRDLSYPPLVGSGGNDGRFEFSNNYAGAVASLLIDGSNAPELLADALHSSPAALQRGLSLAHFLRDASPVNSPSGKSDSLGNPWDLVLGLEGSLVLCAGAARRYAWELEPLLVAPFTARATGAGYPSAIAGERGRAEVWLPLWQRWARLPELDLLAREARAQVGRRQARTGLDFARAAGELGTARGIVGFERYAILERAGKSNLAVPAGFIDVAPRPAVRAIRSLDPWLNPVLRFARGDRCPRSIRDAVSALERSLFDFADRGRPTDACVSLERLGAAEAALAASARRAVEAGIRPLARIPAAPWLDAADDGSVEFGVAIALASLRDTVRGAPAFRDYLHGTRPQQDGGRIFDPELRTRVTRSADPASLLAAIHARRHVDAQGSGHLPFSLGLAADVRALRAFALDQLDDDRIVALASGLSLLDFAGAHARWSSVSEGHLPCPALDTLIIAWHGTPGVPLQPNLGWTARLAAGGVRAVLEEATLRLRRAELEPLLDPAELATGAPPGDRLAAALLAGVTPTARRELAQSLWLATTPINDTAKEGVP